MQRKHANANIHQHQRNTIIRLIYYVLANNLQYIRDSMLSPPTSPPKKITSKTSPLTNLSRREVPFAKDATYQGFIYLSMGRFFYDWGGDLFFSLRRGIILLLRGVCLKRLLYVFFYPLTSWVYVRKFQASCENWWICSCRLILWSSCKRDHYLGGGA